MSSRLTKRLSVDELLVQVLGHDDEGNKIEPEIEEDFSEMEDNMDLDPDFDETDHPKDGEGEAPEEQGSEETFQSKSEHTGQRKSLQAQAPATVLTALPNKDMHKKGSTVSSVPPETRKQS
ncbi:hypothetical protein WMY93_025687 [Mugilogobius chulae]|uniref:Uncharacterized protein n=1 Tax=Mugilogobius chulae TaxID=88201 RepID=A0AAW0MVE0_9GOBI